MTEKVEVVSLSSPAAETSVQQASKQVQVDLQDLGYETCGRSENEAEREDASSPGNKHNFLSDQHYQLCFSPPVSKPLAFIFPSSRV